VSITDVDGNPVVGAKVVGKGCFELECKPMLSYSAITEVNGVATFYAVSTISYFRFIVDNVIKSGYIYMPDLNAVNGITFNP
jgi:hypothetical protein